MTCIQTSYIKINRFVQAHSEWVKGEPAVVQYWLRGSAAARSTAALQAEEGVSQARATCFTLHISRSAVRSMSYDLCAAWRLRRSRCAQQVCAASRVLPARTAHTATCS